MLQYATKTGYFLNRAVGYLALIGSDVRFPRSVGMWVPVGDAVHAPWEVTEMLAASYPELGDVRRLPFIALLSDADVEQFERELLAKGLIDRMGG